MVAGLCLHGAGCKVEQQGSMSVEQEQFIFWWIGNKGRDREKC